MPVHLNQYIIREGK